MRHSTQTILSLVAMAVLAMIPAQTVAQSTPAQANAKSANEPIKFISKTDLSNAVSLIQPKVLLSEKGAEFLLVLPSGNIASGKLQNCEDKKALRNCRTVSFIMELKIPKDKSREELLILVNQLNRRDIHARTFLNAQNQVISRFTFVGTGNETLKSLGHKIVAWDATARRNIPLALNNSSGNENR